MSHISVLLEESVAAIEVKPGSVYIDGTFGGGGHTAEILKKGGKVFAFDLDPEAQARAEAKFPNDLGKNLILINDNFANILKYQDQIKAAGPLDGALYDLGFSSFQIDDGKRGFAFMQDGPLDMRFDNKRQRLTAAQIVMFWDRELLIYIFKTFGEEHLAEKIADLIIAEREISSIDTTQKLASLIERRFKRKFGDIHPATKVFQALRIVVNNELYSIEKGIEGAIKLLNKDGIIAIIAFHSLEDRIVKWYFKHHPQLEELDKKIIRPAFKEVKSNRRARSSKLRVAKKL